MYVRVFELQPTSEKGGKRGILLQVPQPLGLTVHEAGNISNFLERVPLPEVCSSISENSHIAYTNETERPRRSR